MGIPKYPEESRVDFKIVVPTEEDAEKISKALEYLHDGDIDTDLIWVNQIVHSYTKESGTIIVDPNYFSQLAK